MRCSSEHVWLVELIMQIFLRYQIFGEKTASESVLEREQEGNHHWIGNNLQEFL